MTPERQSGFLQEEQFMASRWRDTLAEDRFYNPNFSKRGGIYRDLRLLDLDEDSHNARNSAFLDD
jgi:hypothetical protein